VSPRTRAQDAADSRAAAQQARAHEERLKERFDEAEHELRERFASPIARATRITRQTLALFPVRVWRRFLQANGFLLAAGISYQALFAFFAAIYVGFTIIGIWLGTNKDAINWLIELINSYIPGLISPTSSVATPQDVQDIAAASAGTLTITGLIALGALAWTAIGWVTFSRRAVRDILGLPLDKRGYVLLKARDLVAALVFGAAMVVGSVLNNMGTFALTFLFDILHISTTSTWFRIAVGILSVAISFALNAAALAALFRFLTGVSLGWRRIWPGSLIGGAGITVLQLGAGLLLRYTPSNPLLATFAIFIGLLLWFRLIGVVTLVAASWISVAAGDRDVPLDASSEQARLRAQHEQLVAAARERVRTAQEERDATPWFRRFPADRRVREAENELLRVETARPVAVIAAPPQGRPSRRGGVGGSG